jgi:hypothetical protein
VSKRNSFVYGWRLVHTITAYVFCLQLSEIIVHENYKGRKLHFSSDIALLKLNISVELTWAVLPVCIDWQNEYERFQLSSGSLGVVSLGF